MVMVWYGMVMVWYSMVWHGMATRHILWYGMVRYGIQGSRLAVSRYPRDTRFQIWILEIIGLVSQRDTKKIAKNPNIDEVQTWQRNVCQNNIFSLFVT